MTSDFSPQAIPASAAPAGALKGPLVFAAAEGLVTKPFIVTNGCVYQLFTTLDATNGGRVSYSFDLTEPGAYVIQALVNAPDDAEHSFYVNMDIEPGDENMVWFLPLTAGFEDRFVTWKKEGAGFGGGPGCKIFSLTRGAHQLIIRGRGANTQLNRVIISRLPSPLEGLHPVAPPVDPRLTPIRSQTH